MKILKDRNNIQIMERMKRLISEKKENNNQFNN